MPDPTQTQTYFQDSQGNYYSATASDPGVLVTNDGINEPGVYSVLGTFSTPLEATSVVPEPTSAITTVTGTFFFAAYAWLRCALPPRRAA